MLHICICDDDAQHLKYTEKLVRRSLSQFTSDIDIEGFSSAESLLEQVMKHGYYPDITITDIEMGGMNGIELTRRLNVFVPGCCVIYLTGHAEYCTEAYTTEHTFFVLKDCAREYLGPALEKALKCRNSYSSASIPLNIHGGTVALPVDRVLYIESSLRKLIVHTNDTDYETYGKLDELLNEDISKQFVRCHQSYLVNLRYVTGISGTSFVLTDGSAIPISRSRLNSSKERFLEYYCSGSFDSVSEPDAY